MACSIPPMSRTPTPIANCSMPAAKVECRMTAARATHSAISLSCSNHFPLVPHSIEVKPVALPSGRPRLATKPAPTGSVTLTNTIGTHLSQPPSRSSSIAAGPARMPQRAPALAFAAKFKSTPIRRIRSVCWSRHERPYRGALPGVIMKFSPPDVDCHAPSTGSHAHAM